MPVAAARSLRRGWLAALCCGLLAGTGSALYPLAVCVGALLALMTLPLAGRAVSRRPFHPLEPLWPFLVCYGITFGLKPILDQSGFTTYAWFRFDESGAVAAVLVAIAALIVLLAGYYSGAYTLLTPFVPRVAREPTPNRARIAALVLTLGGAAALLMTLRLLENGLSIVDAVEGRYRIVSLGSAYGRGYLTVLAALAGFAPAIALHTAFRTRQRVDYLFTCLSLLIVLLLFAVLYSRQLILQTVVLLLVVTHFQGRFLRMRSLVALGLGVLALGGFLGLRVRAQPAGPLASIAFLGHTFDSFEFLAPTLEVFPPLGILGGQSVVEDVVLTFLPRAALPFKPDVYGIVRVQNIVAPSFAGTSVKRATFPPGFLVEWYINFGVVGIVLVAALYGVWLRTAREWFWPRRDQLFPLLVYGGLILNLTSMFRSSAQFILQTVVYSGILFGCLYARIPARQGTTRVRRSGFRRSAAAAT